MITCLYHVIKEAVAVSKSSALLYITISGLTCFTLRIKTIICRKPIHQNGLQSIYVTIRIRIVKNSLIFDEIYYGRLMHQEKI